MVISLEVAEHLPKEKSEDFIKNLTNLGDLIVFSAAIPFQGGVNHLNEQWPEYWEKIFKKNDFVTIDCIRKKIWDNKKVNWWYSQNIFIAVKKDKLSNFPELGGELKNNSKILSLVHPENYSDKFNNVSLRRILFSLPSAVIELLRNKLLL